MPKHNRALAKEMGERIERQRKLLGLSQENVASMSGLSYQFFSKVERGESSLGADSILSVCGALGLSPDYLLTGRESNGRAQSVERILEKVPDEQYQQLFNIIQRILKFWK